MKTQIKQIKTLQLIMAVFVCLSFYGQTEIKEKSLFVRVYNLEGDKISKGKISSVSDTLLQLRHGSGIININPKDIGMIKTKRSEGNNILVGSLIGASAGAIIGFASGESNPDYLLLEFSREESAVVGVLLGLPAGAAVGGLSILFKESITFLINGNELKWKLFQKAILN